jgi:hypothetical protein
MAAIGIIYFAWVLFAVWLEKRYGYFGGDYEHERGDDEDWE